MLEGKGVADAMVRMRMREPEVAKVSRRFKAAKISLRVFSRAHTPARPPGVKFDVEGSGYGFRVIRTLSPSEAEMPTTCRMTRAG